MSGTQDRRIPLPLIPPVSSRPDGLSGTRDSYHLPPSAAAILEFTSDLPAGGEGSAAQLPFITSKDAYLWAGVAAALARTSTANHAHLRTRRIEDKRILDVITRVAADSANMLEVFYSAIPRVGYDGTHLMLGGAGANVNVVTSELLIRIISLIWPSRPDWNDLAKELDAAIDSGYMYLMQEGLISDPILDTALTFAIFSMLPFSMTLRTRKGHVEYLRLRAAMWNYERSRAGDNGVTLDLTFETARIAGILKAGLTSAFHERTKEVDAKPPAAGTRDATGNPDTSQSNE